MKGANFDIQILQYFPVCVPCIWNTQPQSWANYTEKSATTASSVQVTFLYLSNLKLSFLFFKYIF